MTFPLMHGYDHINVVADLDPVAAVRDRELGERILRYPKLLPGGSPSFGHAVQRGKEWRIGCLGSDDPSAARYGLAMDLRTAAAAERDPATADAMLAAADRLDPEEGEQLAKDEWEIGDRRYRIIRVEKFILIGDRAMEPPNPGREVHPHRRPGHGAADDPATPAELAEWTALAEEISAAPGHRITARGREFRIVRVGRMLRLGRDGPESPRPGDQSRYGLPDTAEA